MRRISAIFSKQNRALLSELVRTDFKLRYQGSVLGYSWSLLRPLMLFGILYVIFAEVVKSGGGIPHFPVYLLLGVVLWTFFSDMTTQSLGAIVGRGDLVRKIRIPRWIIVLSSSILALINLCLNLIVVAIVMAISHVGIMSSIIFFPLSLIELYLLGLGASLILAATFVKYRDVGYIWELLLQLGFYLTPILYAMSIIPVKFRKLQLLNPVAQAMQDARYDLVSHDPRVITVTRVFNGGWHSLLPVIFVMAVLTAGLLYFKRESKYFAENL